MMFNQYEQAMHEGRMPITIEVKQQPDGEFNATFTDVNGKQVGSVHQDRDEASRRASDKAKAGIISGELQYQR